MPILYVHGVATRETVPDAQVEAYLERFVAPEIADDPENVEIDYVFWGDVAADFAWQGASRPRTPLLGMGADGTKGTDLRAVAELSAALEGLPRSQPTGDGGGRLGAGRTQSAADITTRLKDLTPQQLSDLLAATIQSGIDDPSQRADAALAADAVAHDPETPGRLMAAANLDAEWVALESLLTERVGRAGPLAGMGAPKWLQGMGDRVKETLRRGADVPGFLVTRLAAEMRKPLNDFITMFLGDVFTYLGKRGDRDDPGDIPSRLLAALARARAKQARRGGEPVVVLSHSMGGQLVYDAVTYFLPGLAEHAGTRIDFWCATASQVGLFAELGLFLESVGGHGPDRPVPFPDRAHLGSWWNVWDHNDFISFTVDGIIAGVDDEQYNSGMSVAGAHGGYLQQPSFFRDFAHKLAAARSRNWDRS